MIDGRRGPFGQNSGAISRQAERSLSWSGQGEILRGVYPFASLSMTAKGSE